MKTMKAITATAMTSTVRISPVERAPCRPSSSVLPMAAGKAATMPAKMISEEPLPMPREVICSPSHIRNIVPPVSVISVEMRKNSPGAETTPVCPSSPTAMPYAWKAARMTVR